MRATVTSVTLIFAICAGCAGAARGRPQSTGTAQGSYSGEQALRGKVLYDRHCASCHGADFEPDEGTPRLTGAAFAWRWKDRSAYDYYERI